MRKATYTVMIAILIIGIIHILITPMFYGTGVTVTDLWFASFGLMLMFLVFLNHTILKNKQESTSLFMPGHIANILTTLLVAVLLTQALFPHIILLLVLLIAETALLLYAHSTARPSTINAG